MTTDKLIAITGIVLALSIASERLVEIVKGWVPFLNSEADTAEKEGRRRATLQLMAVVAGILTAWLASDYLPTEMAAALHGWGILGLGLLASGGSGLWNAVLSYLLKVKDLKQAQSAALDRDTKANGAKLMAGRAT